MNHKITQSAKQRHSHHHKISVLILCNLVAVYADIPTVLCTYLELVSERISGAR